VFFDAGNTLIFPRLDEVARDLTAEGYPATVEDFHAAERAGKAKLDEWLWPRIRKGDIPKTIDHFYWGEYLAELTKRVGVPEGERLPVMRRVADRFRDISVWSRVFPETAPFLASLRTRGYYLGVISNSIGTIEEQLVRVDLRKHLDAVLDSALVGVEKPHPEIFALALRRAGAQPSQALFVGDTYATDIGGAELAGLSGVLLDRVGAYPHASCLRITSLPELEQVLA